MLLVNRIGLGPQMRRHVMTTARLAFVAQCGNVYGRDDNALARAGDASAKRRPS
jgi:hypothetical protein